MLLEFLLKYKSSLSLVCIILFSLLSFIFKSSVFARTTSKATVVLHHLTDSFQTLGGTFSGFFQTYQNYENLSQENKKLKKEVQKLEEVTFLYKQLKKENEELLELLNLQTPQGYSIERARIVSQYVDIWVRSLIVNKGEYHGITAYMPVIALQTVSRNKTKYVVVGKVIQVNSHYARVLPITDQVSKLGVRIQNTGDWGLLTGRGVFTKTLDLEFIDATSDIQPGYLVETSGSGGIFPLGLSVGVIGSRIERLDGFQKATVTPLVNFNILDYVFIIKKRKVNFINTSVPAQMMPLDIDIIKKHIEK